MNAIQKHWAGQHRAMTMRGVAHWILAKLLHLCVLVMFGFLWVYPPVKATPVIDVPRDFPSIQGAVDAAVPGAKIKVRSGTYTEQVVIAKDLTLVGEGVGKTIIQAPSALTPYAEVVSPQFPLVALVRITDGAKVALSRLTVTGPVPCGVAAQGIGVVKAATLELKESRITRIQPEFTPCPGPFDGLGIVVGLSPMIEIEGQRGSTGHVIITGVTVDQY